MHQLWALGRRKQEDTSDGCGTRGGIPLEEIGKQVAPVGDLFGLGPTDYTSVKTLKPLAVDASKKVTGQLVAGAHDLPVGFGTSTFDVKLTATTTTGTVIDFGSTTVSGTANGAAVVEVPFELAVPAAAAGLQLKSLVLSVWQRGQNIGYTSNTFKGVSYVVMPLKALKKKK